MDGWRYESGGRGRGTWQTAHRDESTTMMMMMMMGGDGDGDGAIGTMCRCSDRIKIIDLRIASIIEL